MRENQSKQLLFSHMEYIGDDFAADSQAIADHPETRVNIEPLKLRTSNGIYIQLFRNGGRSWKNSKYQFPGKVHRHLKAAMVEQVHGGSHSRSCSITVMNPLLLLKNKIKIRFHLIGILRMQHTVCCIGWQLLREI